jgi:hypothetical protein
MYIGPAIFAKGAFCARRFLNKLRVLSGAVQFESPLSAIFIYSLYFQLFPFRANARLLSGLMFFVGVCSYPDAVVRGVK